MWLPSLPRAATQGRPYGVTHHVSRALSKEATHCDASSP